MAARSPFAPLAVAPVHATEDAPASAPASDRRSQSPANQAENDAQQRETVRVVSLALAACGCSQERAADILGISRRGFQLKLDPDTARCRLSFDEVLVLARAVPGLAEIVGTWLLTSGPAPKKLAPRSPETHAMRLSAAVGEIAECTDEATSDGALTTDEARRLARLHRVVIERCDAAIQDLTKQHDLGDH